MCDADLDYLGTKNFYKTGNTLFQEFLAYKVIANEKEWDALQIRFLTNHHYHTDFAIKNREPLKQIFLQELKYPSYTINDGLLGYVINSKFLFLITF